MDDGEPVLPHHWSARKLKPIIVLYVVGVFLGFMALAYFVFHSMTGVKALAVGALGSVVPLLFELGKRIEYRLTEQRLERRPVAKDKPTDFQLVFELNQLSHIVPMRRGFKFYRDVNEPNPVKRFWRAHISDAYSGEVHVEPEDLEDVLAILTRRGVSAR